MNTAESSGPDDGERLSIEIINAIAEFEDADPIEVRPVLYDIIDPDALDSLFADTQRGQSRTAGHVTFRYDEHKVTVHSDGDVNIQPLPSSADSTSSNSTSSDSTTTGSGTTMRDH